MRLLLGFLLLGVCISAKEASVKELNVVLLGPGTFNEVKRHTAARFLPDVNVLELLSKISSEFMLFAHTLAFQSEAITHVPVQTKNGTSVVLSAKNADEMNLDDIQTLYEIVRSSKPLVIVEFGDATVQLRALLGKNSGCWGRGKASIAAPHNIYLCNEVHPNRIKMLKISNIHNIRKPMEYEDDPARVTFWPTIFASAAKSKKGPAPEPDEEETVVVIENDEDERKINFGDNDYQNKMVCKYRKSCYETGVLPDLKEQWNFPSITGGRKKDEHSQIGDNLNDDNSDDQTGKEVDVTTLKLKCKYRPSCYERHGINIKKHDDGKDEDKMSFFSGKLAAPQGKKRTVKEIAERTLQKVKAREEEMKERELPSSIRVERKLEAMEKEMEKKIGCKYRKSCYETGELPKIPQGFNFEIPTFGIFEQFKGHKNEEPMEFSDLSEIKKREYCKYRKSCMDSGVKPTIESHRLFAVFFNYEQKDQMEVIEDNIKVSPQLRCKYRLSCYETGVVPDITLKEVVVAKSEIESAVPTSTAALKAFCKYRKSCYETIASEVDGAAAIKEIRKLRIAEKVKRQNRRRYGRRRVIRNANGTPIRRMTRKEKAALRREARIAKLEAERLQNEQLEQYDDADHMQKRKEKVEESAHPHDQRKQFGSEKVDEPEEEPKTETTKPIKEEQGLEPIKKKNRKRREEAEEDVQETRKTRQIKKKKTENVDVVEEIAEEIVSSKEQQKVKKTKKESKKKMQEPDVDSQSGQEEVSPQPKRERATEETKTAERAEKKLEQKVQSKTRTPKEVKTRTSKEIEEVPHEEKHRPEKLLEIKKNKVQEKAPKEKEERVDLDTSEPLLSGFATIQEQRLFCKYRKSCYETGVVPEIDRTYIDVINDFNKHVENQYQTELQKHIHEEDKKLSCKYRKSCYETGQLPKIVGFNDAQMARTPSFDEELSIQMRCKYRKSCYEKHGLKKEDVDGEEKGVQESKPKLKEKIKTSVHVAHNERKEERRRRKEIEVEKEPSEEQEHADDRYRTEASTLSHQEKLHCKYRRSCYSTAEPRTTREDHAGSMARQTEKKLVQPTRYRKDGEKPRDHCHPYWLSCREWLGLPPKEKAPIGPNGKRLCRKKVKHEQ